MTEHPAISAICTQLRVGQQELANWREGRLAVSAVPGLVSQLEWRQQRRLQLHVISYIAVVS
jgi:hypothetical protein